MAYVVSRPRDTWELRESRTTPRGPRSRTLASFRVLDADTITRALERASTPLETHGILRAAQRAGAPIAVPAANHAAAALLRELGRGREPSTGLRRAVLGVLGAGEPLSDAERSAAAWLGASAEERGAALRDLLLLADRVPQRRRGAKPRFPRLDSGGSP